MSVKMKDIIQIEPFKFSIVQIVLLCFLAGVTWAGYLNLSASVVTLNTTMKTVNETMIVIQSDQRHREDEMERFRVEADRNQVRETGMEIELGRHSVRLDSIESVVFK